MPIKPKPSLNTRKKYYSISDVVEITGIKAPTLRNWETLYPELRRVKRINNRRTYTYEDIEFILGKVKESPVFSKHFEKAKSEPQLVQTTSKVVPNSVSQQENVEEPRVPNKVISDRVSKIRNEISGIREILKEINSRLKASS